MSNSIPWVVVFDVVILFTICFSVSCYFECDRQLQTSLNK